jgi:plastocyanin
MRSLEGEMAVNRTFKLGAVVVLIFILLTGVAASAQDKEKTTKATANQTMTVTMNHTTQTTNQTMNQTTNQTHTIVFINSEVSPETTEVNQYDTVIWRNLNKPKRTFVLVSEDKLWEDVSLGYGRIFKYTFNETGTFAFSIEGEKDLKGTVIVGESKETAGVPLTEKETRQIQQEEREGLEEEEVTPAPTEEVTPTPVTEFRKFSIDTRVRLLPGDP